MGIAQGHVANKWQHQDSNSNILLPEPINPHNAWQYSRGSVNARSLYPFWEAVMNLGRQTVQKSVQKSLYPMDRRASSLY